MAFLLTVCIYILTVCISFFDNTYIILMFFHRLLKVSTPEGTKNIVEIRNFLGEKQVRRVALLEGVNYFRSPDIKDQIEISGKI